MVMHYQGNKTTTTEILKKESVPVRDWKNEFEFIRPICCLNLFVVPLLDFSSFNFVSKHKMDSSQGPVLEKCRKGLQIPFK